MLKNRNRNANDGTMCVRKSFIIPFVGFRQFGNGQGDAFIRMKRYALQRYTQMSFAQISHKPPQNYFFQTLGSIYKYSKLFVIFLQKF